jgi:hypothetical protein
MSVLDAVEAFRKRALSSIDRHETLLFSRLRSDSLIGRFQWAEAIKAKLQFMCL